MPPDADLRGVEASSRPADEPVAGFIDRVYDRRITGWAWNRTEPDAILEVEIRLDEIPIATARSDRLRRDLVRRGYGDGRHGFDVRLSEMLPADARGRLAAIAILPDGGRVRLGNRAAELATPETAPEAVVAAVPDALRAWLADFQAVQRQLESSLTGAVRDLRAPRDAADDAAAHALANLAARRQDELAKQIAALEVVQARIDAALARLDGRADAGDAPDRWLRRAVLLLAMVSGASLTLGVASLFY
jgi:hypothetical protein